MKNDSHPVVFFSLILIGAGLLALGFVLFAELTSKRESRPEQDLSALPVAVNFPAPELKLVDVESTPVSLSAYRGQVVLVNLWATWCPPCKAELPALQTFYETNKEAGFVIVGIDDGETMDVVDSFIKQYGLTYPIWLDADFKSERAFGTLNLPSSWVINRQGQVVLLWVGAISAERLAEYVLPIIKE